MLSAEQRVKVAEACTNTKCNILGGRVFVPKNVGSHYWDPDERYDNWQALVQKVARLLKELDASPCGFGYYDTCVQRYIDATATNSTDDLEQLAWELIEGME